MRRKPSFGPLPSAAALRLGVRAKQGRGVRKPPQPTALDRRRPALLIHRRPAPPRSSSGTLRLPRHLESPPLSSLPSNDERGRRGRDCCSSCPFLHIGLLPSMASESSGKAHLVTLVTSALQIANSWVNETSGSTAETSEASGIELEARPLRMGIGSKVSRYVEIAASDDPVERKLMGKLGVGKRPQSSKPMRKLTAGKRPRSFKSQEGGSATPSEVISGGSDDDDSDSRATAFVKKAAAPVMPPPQRKKSRSTR